MSAIESTDMPNVYKFTGTVYELDVEDEYVFYKDGMLAFGYTSEQTFEIAPVKKLKRYFTGTVKDGKMTFIGFDLQDARSVLIATSWERIAKN
ncbi:MAG: hypothetical protein ACKVU0_18740 [Saprospiraceae bacterium]